MEPMIEQVTIDLLGPIREKTEMEVVSEFAVELPMTIIAKALGVGIDDLDTFKSGQMTCACAVGNPDPSIDKVRDYLISLKGLMNSLGIYSLSEELTRQKILSQTLLPPKLMMKS